MINIILSYVLGGIVLFVVVSTAVKVGVKEAIIELKKQGII